MIRIGDDPFFAVRKRAIAAGLDETCADSGLRPGRDPATGDVVVADARGRRTRFCFDRRGFVGGVVSPLGRRWEIASDAQGRPASFGTPAGGRLDVDYDPAGRIARVGRGPRAVCRVEHDERGRVGGYLFPDGTATRLDRDPAGRLATMTDRRGFARAFHHGADGLLASMTDGRGGQTRFEYEALDRPSRLTYPDGSSETYQYDPAGRVSSIRAGDGSGVAIARDAAGRPVAIDAGDGDLARFSYDEGGRIVRAEDAATTVEFGYDAAGRLVAESRGGEVVGYEYDEAGTLVALRYPTGERATFDRDDDLRLTRVADWAGAAYQFEHPADDRWLTIRAPSGLVTTIELTVDGQVAEIFVRTPIRPSAGGGAPSGGEPLFATTYHYDAEDRLARAVDAIGHGERPYHYDAEGHLVAAGGESFAYDPAGNRVRVGGEVAEFDAADRLTSQGALRCEYDARGNLVGWFDRGESWRFHYDSRNRMTRAEGGAGRVVTFGYDAFGRRTWKRSGGVTTRFTWAGEQLIGEARSDGTGRDYLYPPGSPTPLAIRDRGVIYAVHPDHLGTPRRLTDPRGAVAWSAEGDAFGHARVAGQPAVANPIRFPGHYHDEETGLHYNRFRYYSPRLGRYLTRDPASYLGGLNLYAYAGNDPINVIDPLGLWPSWQAVVPTVAGAAVGAAAIMRAPTASPAAIALAGAAAGAVGAGLNQALNDDRFSTSCMARGATTGAAAGALASVPLALPPAGAGVLGYGGVGGLGGGIAAAAGHLLGPGSRWSWRGLAASVALGAVAAGVGQYLAGRVAQPRSAPPGDLAPGGGLAAHEAAGGHTIAKHVGKAEADLAARLAAEPHIAGASTFTDRAVAEQAAFDALRANAADVATWLAGADKRKNIHAKLGYDTGPSLARGATAAATLRGTMMVLERDPAMPTGYKIITSYPTTGDAPALPPSPTAAPAPTGDLAPGGGLAAHEAAGGTAIADHVGKTDAELAAQLAAASKLAAASTFPDRAVADQAVADALKAKAADIATWLATPQVRKTVDFKLGHEVGRVQARGSTKVSTVKGVRVILERDPAMPTGYKIVTAHPRK